MPVPDGFYWLNQDGKLTIVEIDSGTVYYMNDERTSKLPEIDGEIIIKIEEPQCLLLTKPIL